MSLIKGGGGALLREKIVATASARMVVIADNSKLVDVLGRFPLPIEVVAFGFAAIRRRIEKAAVEAGCPGPALLRRTREGHPFVTDSGHLIVDAALERIPDPASLAARLALIPGVVEHGLFVGIAQAAIIGDPTGDRSWNTHDIKGAHHDRLRPRTPLDGAARRAQPRLRGAEREPPGAQPSPQAMALAKELILLKGGQQMFGAVVPGVIESTKDVFLPTNPNLSKPLGEVSAQLKSEFASKSDELMNEVAKVYATHFTEQELKEAVAFYKTALGKKLLAEEPVAIEAGFTRAKQWANDFSGQVMTRMRAEMKKKGYDL